MKKKLLWFFVVSVLTVSLALAGGAKKKAVYEEPLNENQPVNLNAHYNPLPDPDWSRITDVGTATTLSGFYDYQSNGGSVQYIRVNPANGRIHTIMMLADDSTAAGLNAARRVAYAYSSNNGSTWTNFSNVRVPARRAGFPSLDLLKGANAGLPAIANHNVSNATLGNQPIVYVDSPEGAGAFSELNPPPDGGFAADQPIWPYVAGASDGSVVVAGSRSAGTTGHYNRTADFATWGTWGQVASVTQSGGRYPTQANGTGRVGIVYNHNNPVSLTTGGNWFTESTNNGVTWSTATNLYGFRVAAPDTFLAYVHTDFVYNGNNPLFVFSETHNTLAVDQISFWSQATGFKVAVAHDTTKYKFDPINQRFHALRLGWPSIGLSGSTIVVAYQAFQADTDSRGYHYSDVWYVKSDNNGTTWSTPVNLTNTRTTDERYPSVSKWNAAGRFDLVWVQKNKSGLYAFPGGADTVRASQVWQRQIITDVGAGVGGVANSFKLNQNYPNPFNPATKIDYTVAQAGPVSIKVYNTLGQEAATLLNENLSPGTYQVTFDGGNLSSGVYLYTMRAGGYTESKKMVFMK